MKKKIGLFFWFTFGRFLPGHNLRSISGRLRTKIASACLEHVGTGSGVGPFVDFGNGRDIFLGNNSGISSGSVVKGGASIKICDRVVMGPNVMILSSTHHYSIINGKWSEERLSLPITIHDECFIGAGSIILAGVSIGPRSIVAAGSVVCKDVPEGCMVGGVPAHFLRTVQRLL